MLKAQIDPSTIDFSALFGSPSMFDSRKDWAAAGFTVFDRHDESRILVAEHSCAPGLLFKKYSSATTVDQCRNYEARVDGADKVREIVRSHGLKHVIVPKKWIIDLPAIHGPCAHVLAVEKLDLLEVNEIKNRYRTIDAAVLRELCLVLFRLRGLDSIIDNVAFTSEGKLAFIDTEHWYGGRRRPYLRHIRRYLSSDNRRFAKKLFRQFEHNHRKIDQNVFVDEEDTSSWSILSS